MIPTGQIYWYSQICLVFVIVVRQMVNQRKAKQHIFWVLVKVLLSFQVFKIYLILIISEMNQMHYYLEIPQSKSMEIFRFLDELEQNLFYLSLSIFGAVAYFILFLRVLQINSLKLKNLHKMDKLNLFLIGIKVMIQTLLFQMVLVFGPLLYLQISNQEDQIMFIKIIYIRLILLLSFISSADPILQIMIGRPIRNFIKTYNGYLEKEYKPLPYQYVQLQRTEYLDQFEIQTQDSPEKQESILKFDSEVTDEEAAQASSFKLNIFNVYHILRNSIRVLCQMLFRTIMLLISFVQLLFAIMVLFALICIFIELLYPQIDILSQLNAVDFFTPNSSIQPKSNILNTKTIEVFVIFLFKISFVILMYFSSQNCIRFKQRSDILNDMNNIIVIVRKNLLNFSMIGLLSTLYPNLTMTIDNSDCYKNYMYKNGQFGVISPNYGEVQDCQITIIALLKMKIFEGNISLLTGVLVLLLYIIHSFYIIFKIQQKRDRR